MTTIASTELWRQCRGMENSYRYFSDIVIGIIRLVPGGKLALVELDEKTRQTLAGEWDNFCRPPWCMKGPKKISEAMHNTARRAEALATAIDKLLAMLPKGAEEIEYYASELPGTHWRERIPEDKAESQKSKT